MHKHTNIWTCSEYKKNNIGRQREKGACCGNSKHIVMKDTIDLLISYFASSLWSKLVTVFRDMQARAGKWQRLRIVGAHVFMVAKIQDAREWTSDTAEVCVWNVYRLSTSTMAGSSLVQLRKALLNHSKIN